MISIDNYLKSLQRVAIELPDYLKNIDQLDEDLIQEHTEQFKWLLNARFIFLYQTNNIKNYINQIMKFNHQILLLKENLYLYMGIDEQEIICPYF